MMNYLNKNSKEYLDNCKNTPTSCAELTEVRRAYQDTIKIGTIEACQKFLKEYENDSSARFQVMSIKKRMQKLNN